MFSPVSPDPGLHHASSITDEDEVSDIVDWDNLSVNFDETDEATVKFNCPFIEYEAQESSAEESEEANEIPSKKLNFGDNNIQLVGYSSSSDENYAF